MAKRSNRSRNQSSLSTRRDIVNPSIANQRLLGRSLIRTQSQMLLDLARTFGQDDRAYSPIRTSRPARTVTGRVAGVSIQKRPPLRKARFQFDVPDRAVVCVRRKQRKEVLHAYGKTGSHTRSRRPRRNQWSDVRC